MYHLTGLMRLFPIAIGIMATVGVRAQTPGLTYKPSSTSFGKSVLDPNGDGYVSATSSGFSGTDYGSGSEFDMVPLPIITPEPLGDLTTGSSGGNTDIVTATGNQSCYILYREVSGTPYLLFRVRLGGASTASKGYSFLLDTDGNFAGTGTNPGYEKEVQMGTGSNGAVSVITFDASGNVTARIDYDIDAYSQRSIALSTNGGDADYFYDFFVPFSALGVGSQTVRIVPVTITSAGNGLTGTKSDFNGVNDQAYRNNPEFIARDLIAAFPPTSLPSLTPGASFPNPRTLAPVVTGGINVSSTSIGGTLREPAGTPVTVYRNGTSIGTANVDAAGNWTLTGVSGLAAGQLITADALAAGKTRSPLSTPVEVTSVQSCYLPVPTIVSDQPSGNKYFTITWKWPVGMDPALNPIKIRVYSVTPAGVLTLINVAQDLVHTGNGEGTCTYLYGSTGNISGSYLATASSTICTSGYSNTYNTGDGGNKNTVTTAPVINTTTLYANTGSTNITVTNAHPTTANLFLYVNGLQVGSFTNVAGNTARTFTYTGLIDGDIVQARADGTGTNEVISNYSNTVSVLASAVQTIAPVITGTYVAGATSISGTSTEAAGTIVYLYRSDTVLIGSATVSAFGTWTVTGIALSAGDVVTARAKAFGKTLSAASASKTVAASTPNAPTISGSYTYLSTQISGTGGNGTVTVYVDGSPIGTTTGASWTLSSIPAGQLYRGARITATNTVNGVESAPSVAVTVTGVVSFLITSTADGAIGTQTAGVPFDIKVTAKEGTSGSGNTFTGYTGKVTVTSSSFVISGGGVSPAFTAGILSPHSMSLRTAGTGKTITVVSTDDPTATGTATLALILPNNTYKLLLSKPADIPAGTRAAYTVSRQDAYENPTTSGGLEVHLTSSSTSSRFFSAASGGVEVESLVIDDGLSTGDIWFTDTVAGNRFVIASDASPANGDTGLLDATDTLSVYAGPPTSFFMTAPTYVRTTGSSSITAQLRDAYGNPVSTPGLTVNWTANPGDGSYYSPSSSSTTDASGLATIQFNPPSGAPSGVEYTLTSTSGSYIGNVKTTVVNGKVWIGKMDNRSDQSANWQDDALPQTGDTLFYDPAPKHPLVLQQSLVFSDIYFRGSDTAHRIIVNGRRLAIRGRINLNGQQARIRANGPDDEVEMSGSSEQTIPAGAFEDNEVGNLRIDNGNGVRLEGQLILKGKLTPSAGTLTTNGHLILRSDSNGTARVLPGSGEYISGTVTAERYVKRNGNSGGTGRAWRMLSVPVTGTRTLRDWLMNGRSGQDLTLQANRDAEAAGIGAPIVGHIYATASEATAAGFDWIGVPLQFSSVRYFKGVNNGGLFESSQVPSLSTTFDEAAQGYMVFVRGDRKTAFPSTDQAGATTLHTIGELKKGDQTVRVVPATTSQYSIVGNPYMSVLDLDAFYNDNASVIKPAFLLWDANIPGVHRQGSYVTVTKSGSQWVTNIGTHVNPQLLESGMAFLVEPVDGLTSPADVTIRESHKSNAVHAGMMPFSNGAIDPHGLLHIRIERPDGKGDRGIVDGVLVDFHSSHVDGIGDPMDIVKLRNGISQGALWLSADGRPLSVEGRPWPSNLSSGKVPLHMGGVGGQSFVVSVHPKNMARPGLRAWLKDRLLDREVEIDLSRENEYPFVSTGNPDSDSLRFEVVFAQQTDPASLSLRAQAVKRDAMVEVRWQMAGDAGVRYEVQRSAEGERFVTLHATDCDPRRGGSYQWSDAAPLRPAAFYRVKAVLPDGRTFFSAVLRVELERTGAEWLLYPNPSEGEAVRLKAKDVQAGRYRIVLLDATGRSLSSSWIDHDGGDSEYPVNLPIPTRPGTHFIRIMHGGRPVATLRMMRK